jgi:hypothetical protein
MTRDDLVDDNHDLLEHCGALLRGKPHTHLLAKPVGDASRLEITTEGLDRVEPRVDGRSLGSQPVADGTTTIELPPDWTCVELAAYEGPELRQRRLLRR